MTDRMAGRLATAIEKLEVQIRRYNDLHEPPKPVKREAEFGKASYGDRQRKEDSEQLHSKFQIDAQAKSTRRS